MCLCFFIMKNRKKLQNLWISQQFVHHITRTQQFIPPNPPETNPPPWNSGTPTNLQRETALLPSSSSFSINYNITQSHNTLIKLCIPRDLNLFLRRVDFHRRRGPRSIRCTARTTTRCLVNFTIIVRIRIIQLIFARISA